MVSPTLTLIGEERGCGVLTGGVSHSDPNQRRERPGSIKRCQNIALQYIYVFVSFGEDSLLSWWSPKVLVPN